MSDKPTRTQAVQIVRDAVEATRMSGFHRMECAGCEGCDITSAVEKSCGVDAILAAIGEPEALSESDRRAAVLAYWENCPDVGFLSDTFAAFVERLDKAGLAIVRVRPA